MYLLTPTLSSWLGTAVPRTEANYQRSADWRYHNIAESMFSQMSHERFASPRWIVVGAGTTSCIGGLGRPKVEASFIRSVIDRLVDIDNTDSLAAMQTLPNLLSARLDPQPALTFMPC